MTIGELRERVTFQVRSDGTGDGVGGGVVGWTNIATNPEVWAHVRPLGASETLRAGALAADVVYEITVRRRSDLTADMRVVRGSDTLQIVGVSNDSARRWTIVRAQKGPN